MKPVLSQWLFFRSYISQINPNECKDHLFFVKSSKNIPSPAFQSWIFTLDVLMEVIPCFIPQSLMYFFLLVVDSVIPFVKILTFCRPEILRILIFFKCFLDVYNFLSRKKFHFVTKWENLHWEKNPGFSIEKTVFFLNTNTLIDSCRVRKMEVCFSESLGWKVETLDSGYYYQIMKNARVSWKNCFKNLKIEISKIFRFLYMLCFKIFFELIFFSINFCLKRKF